MADIQLGKAWVEIVPSAKGISNKIQKTLDPDAKKAGKKAGDSIKNAIQPGATQAGKQAGKQLNAALSPEAKKAGKQIATALPQEAKKAGTKAGKDIAKAIPQEVKNAGKKAGEQVGKELETAVPQKAQKAGEKAGKEVANAIPREATKGGQKAGDNIANGLKSRKPFRSLITDILPSARRAGDEAGQTMAQRINAKLKTVGAGLKSAGASIKAAAPQMMKIGAMASAASIPLIAGIKKSMEAYKVQSAAETKLVEIYKTRMGVSKKAAQSTMDLASKLQKQGVIGDEVALSGAQQLATYAKMPGTVNTILPAMENLLAQQKGVNATAEDATQMANLMGKAMMGQTGALKRVGISFDEAQEKVLKYGTEEEKAAMLAKVVTQNVGNMNKEMLKTPEGKIQQLKNSLGDLVESVGAALAPALASAANWLSENLIPKLEQVVGFLQSHPVIAKIVVGLTALLAVGGPLLIFIGGVISAIGTIGSMIGALTGVITTIGGVIGGVVGVVGAPIIAIVAGIAALTVALIYAYRHSETFRNAVQKVAQVLKGLALAAFEKLKSAAHTLATAFRKIWAVVGPKVTVAFQKLRSMMPTIISVIKRMISISLLPLRIAFKAIWTVIKTVIAIIKTIIKSFKSVTSTVSSMVSSIRSHMSKVYSLFASPFNKAHKTISGVVDKIKNFFPLKLGKILSFSIPKISISSIVKKIGGKSASAPNFDVKFQNFARGAILDEPTLIGYRAGEAGREGIIPLEGRYMRPFANAIAGEMRGGTVINNHITVNGTESPEDYANRLAYQLKVQLRTV